MKYKRGAIAGIVIGSIFFVAIIKITILCYFNIVNVNDFLDCFGCRRNNDYSPTLY